MILVPVFAALLLASDTATPRAIRARAAAARNSARIGREHSGVLRPPCLFPVDKSESAFEFSDFHLWPHTQQEQRVLSSTERNLVRNLVSHVGVLEKQFTPIHFTTLKSLFCTFTYDSLQPNLGTRTEGANLVVDCAMRKVA
jgi:hypothetical protein